MTRHETSRRSVLAAMGAAPLIAAAGTTSASASSGRVPADLRPGGKLDQLITQLAAEDTFSGTVLLTHRGKPVLSRSVGMADKARSIPNGPDTLFCLGSITKTWTGVAVAQLAQQGKVSLGGKVGRYLDGFPAEVADAVTVHHLLTHTSGLGDFHSPEYFEQARTWDTVDEFWDGTMGFVRALEPGFVPGSRGTYSNAGYVILGAIVAQVSGKSYYDYIREHVLAPAGMSVSGFHTKPEWQQNRQMAHPYHERQPGAGRVDVLDRKLLIGLPPGGSFASAPDLVRFANAFQSHKFLNPAFTHLFASPKLPLTPDHTFFQAYAVGAHLTNGQWSYGHNGGSDGVSANVEWFPDSGWVAVVLANYSHPAAAPIDKLARDLITGR